MLAGCCRSIQRSRAEPLPGLVGVFAIRLFLCACGEEV
jgi:hypothetical protein